MAVEFILGDYKYSTNDFYPNEVYVEANDKTKTSYAAMPNTVTYGGKTYRVTLGYLCFQGCSNLSTPPKLSANLTNMSYMFADCSALTTAPTIPSGVTDLDSCFKNCSALTTAPALPNSATNLDSCFENCSALTTAPVLPDKANSLNSCFANCSALTTAPVLPSGATNLGSCFKNCSALTTAPTIPSGVVSIGYMFAGCSALTTAPTIPGGVEYASYCFYDCVSLTGEIQINTSKLEGYTTYRSMLLDTTKGIWLTGSSSQLQSIARTANNGNVFVGKIPIEYSLTAERVGSNGGTTPEPEGDWLHLVASITWSNFAANSIDSMGLTINGTSISSTAYTDASKTEAITLPGWRPAAQAEAHAWIQVDTDTQVITFTVSDAYHTGATISLTVPQVFRTFDFLKGGRGLAIGAVAEADGLKVGMDTAFQGDVYLQLDDTEDADILQALSDLGWTDDVLTSIVLNRSSASISAGSTVALTATTTPSGLDVIWESSNESVATVSQSGTVSGVASGTAVISASINTGGVLESATCTITVG